MANCWRCGGEMSPYAIRCNWCGRSTTVSAFFQVLTIGVVIAVGLVVSGVMPTDAVTRYLPTGLFKDPPLPQRAPTAAEGSGRGEAPGGYGRPESRAAATDRRPSRADEEAERRRRAAREQRLTAAADDRCDSAERIDALARRYDTWAAADLRLIACREVREGFTLDQVRASRGRPLRQVDSAGAEVWVYRDMQVVVQDDRVIAIRSN